MFNCERYITSTLESKYTQFADTMREIVRMASGKKSRAKESEEEQSGKRERMRDAKDYEEWRKRDLWQPVAQPRSLVRLKVSTGA